MKKFCLAVLCCMFYVTYAKAQFVSQYSQYMVAKGSFNPAAIAEGNMMHFYGIHRQQWVGMPGAPVDTYISLSMPVSFNNKLFGVGIAINNEKLGLFTKQYAQFQGVYKTKIQDGILSVGTNIGAISIKFQGDSVHIPTGNDYHIAPGTDNLIPTSAVSGMSLDLGFGVYYTTSKWYAGISVLDVNQPTINWSETQETYVGSMAYATGGYNFPISDSRFTLKPSLLIKTNFIDYQTDIDLLVESKEKFWGGLAYRLKESLIFLGGIKLTNGLTIGYSFDLPLTKIITTSFGSHELFLAYDFNISFEKKKNRYKSIRIL